jgi:hypothetical protein
MKTGKIEFSPDYKSKSKRHSDIGSLVCQGMSGFEYERLIEWMKDPKRKPAIIAFTSGHTPPAPPAIEGRNRL